MSFPPGSSQARLRGIPHIRVRPQLTLAMSAVVTLTATFLVDHRVTATLWTKIARDAQMAQA